ncbi:uncharacterized protein A1O9_02914 [Exophiala aquamarina CBS 119918]|uniref:GAF domain-containing protein n=1 Tax=Exophiala aquamarina CBS 119918 TaxID=1182545 RepID=A0A072PPU9_9EURO|nr:uncharacterized protein A1O9_02914 [Exophiala aquamarina CBS 119918]KEF61348.1 hypothetical protein A1O9_02914 [Exophiala aquamarina CBS 119918]
MTLLRLAVVTKISRYFKATSRAVHSTPPDIDSSTAYAQHIPRLAADPNLNALAQLEVTRLDCERAFISLIDSRNQHIISETTRSISLFDTDIHEPGDGLCMGEVPLDLFAGVCAGTIPIFTSQTGEKIRTKNIYADQSRYVINDFTQEAIYKTPPYVTGFPHMRYYAEVPLKSKSGYVLGSYCVVDSKPRAGLDDDGYRVLTEVASAVMRHLDLIKTNDDHSRSTQLFHGLHDFALSHPLGDDEPESGKDMSITDSSSRKISDAARVHETEVPIRISSHIPSSFSQHSRKQVGASAPMKGLDNSMISLNTESPTRQRQLLPRPAMLSSANLTPPMASNSPNELFTACTLHSPVNQKAASAETSDQSGLS